MIVSNNGTLQEYQKLRQEDNFIMYKLTDELNNIFFKLFQKFKMFKTNRI